MATTNSPTASRIKAAQAMRRAAQMSDPDFNALKMRVTGQPSLTNMTTGQIDRVIAELQRLYPCLVKPAGKRRRDPAPAAGLARLWSKIDAQLHSLGKDRSYLDGDIKTKIAGGISAWRFADAATLGKVIAALAYQQQRTGAPTN